MNPVRPDLFYMKSFNAQKNQTHFMQVAKNNGGLTG